MATGVGSTDGNACQLEAAPELGFVFSQDEPASPVGTSQATTLFPDGSPVPRHVYLAMFQSRAAKQNSKRGLGFKLLRRARLLAKNPSLKVS